MADYPSSTQRSSWTFDRALLAEHRSKARAKALKQHENSAFTPSLEQKLLAHYGLKLIQLSRTLKLPDKVTSTACAYLRRFYVKKSCLEVDPQGIVLTCLYLAGKVEDCYLSAERLHDVGGIPEDIILKSELVLLQGLEFDLTCHCAYKALYGGKLDGHSDTSSVEARKKMDRLLITDAVLLFTPGQLARYCLGVTDGNDSDEVRRGIDECHEQGKVAEEAEKNANETQTIDKTLKSERKRLK